MMSSDFGEGVVALVVTIKADFKVGLLGGERDGDVDAVAPRGCAVVSAALESLSRLLSVVVVCPALKIMSCALFARTHPSSRRACSSASLLPPCTIEYASSDYSRIRFRLGGRRRVGHLRGQVMTAGPSK